MTLMWMSTMNGAMEEYVAFKCGSTHYPIIMVGATIHKHGVNWESFTSIVEIVKLLSDVSPLPNCLYACCMLSMCCIFCWFIGNLTFGVDCDIGSGLGNCQAMDSWFLSFATMDAMGGFGGYIPLELTPTKGVVWWAFHMPQEPLRCGEKSWGMLFNPIARPISLEPLM